MSSLFELSRKFSDLLEMYEQEDADEHLHEAVANTLESVEFEFNDKVINCVKYMKNLQAQSDAIKLAVDSMNKRRVQLDKRAESLKSYVLNNMQQTQIKAVECEYFKVSIKKNPQSVQVIDESLVPLEFKRTKTVVEIDKGAIKQAGGCDGVILVQNESLSIK